MLLAAKNSPASAGEVRDLGLIPGSGRSPGGGHGNPLQYSCLENPTDRGAWKATARGVAKSRTPRSGFPSLTQAPGWRVTPEDAPRKKGAPSPQVLERYAMCAARWIQCEESLTTYGLLGKHPTTGQPVMSPFVNMSSTYMNQTNRLWNEIFQIILLLRQL